MSVEWKSTIFVTIAASAIAGTVAWYNTIRSVEKVKGNAENIAVASYKKLKTDLDKVANAYKYSLKMHQDRVKSLQFRISEERSISEKLRGEMDLRTEESKRKIQKLKAEVEDVLKNKKDEVRKLFTEKLEKANREHTRILNSYSKHLKDLVESQQNLRESHTQEIETHGRQLELLQQSLENTCRVLEQERLAHENAKVNYGKSLEIFAESLRKIKQSHAGHMKSMQESHKEVTTHLESQVSAHDVQLEGLKRRHNRQIDAKDVEVQAVRDIMKRQIEASQKKHENEIKSLKIEQRKEIEKMSRSRRLLELEHKSVVETRDKEFAQVKAQCKQIQYRLEEANSKYEILRKKMTEHDAERLEGESCSAYRISLFIAMLLARETICQGPGTITKISLIIFLRQINSPLFSKFEDSASLASALIPELCPTLKQPQVVGAGKFAQYLFSNFRHQPLILKKMRTIALASYLPRRDPPANIAVSPASKSAMLEFHENNIRRLRINRENERKTGKNIECP
jgi:F0F1-type ATP synthase membrane subunit b/b'